MLLYNPTTERQNKRQVVFMDEQYRNQYGHIRQNYIYFIRIRLTCG
jgi:hypothetical protein